MQLLSCVSTSNSALSAGVVLRVRRAVLYVVLLRNSSCRRVVGLRTELSQSKFYNVFIWLIYMYMHVLTHFFSLFLLFCFFALLCIVLYCVVLREWRINFNTSSFTRLGPLHSTYSTARWRKANSRPTVCVMLCIIVLSGGRWRFQTPCTRSLNRKRVCLRGRIRSVCCATKPIANVRQLLSFVKFLGRHYSMTLTSAHW